MANDRFKDYDSEVRDAVIRFEQNEEEDGNRYFDEEEMEMIIDFYLDEVVNAQQSFSMQSEKALSIGTQVDMGMLEKAVDYGLKLFPQSVEMRLRLSHLMCAKGQYKASLKVLEALEAVEPGNCDVMYALGAVHSALEEPRKAIEYYERAAEDAGDLATIYGNIGDEYANMGMHDKAVEYYKKSIRQDRGEERSLDNLGASLEAENRGSEAVEYFEGFVKEEPYSRMGWFSLGSAYYSEQMMGKAVEAFRYALAIDDKFAEAYIGLSDCYRAMGKTAQAVETLRELLPLTDDKAVVYNNIASIYHDADNYDTAIIYYEKAVREAPYVAEFWTHAAYCFLDLGDRGMAMQYSERGAKLNPQSSYCTAVAAYIHAQCGDDEAAADYYEQAVALATDDEGLWIEYADLLMRMGRYSEAIDLLHEGLTHCQQAYFFYARLAVCYYKTGQRNFLGNALRACSQYKDTYGLDMLFILCPEMERDIDVINTITE